jgi:hypothetical protein
VAAVCGLLLHSYESSFFFFLFSLLSLFFLPVVRPSLGVFSLAGSFRCLFLLFWFVGALYVAWVSFTWVYFLLELFFFRKSTKQVW